MSIFYFILGYLIALVFDQKILKGQMNKEGMAMMIFFWGLIVPVIIFFIIVVYSIRFYKKWN
jgi:heme/copper-type cytochrome/quinol oxidase subunit 2